MLTALHIENTEYKNSFSRFMGRLRRNRIKVEVKTVGRLSLKCVEYKCYSSHINWRLLDKKIGAQRNRLLCSSELCLPHDLHYKRFENDEYKHRLCTNTAISLLSRVRDLPLKVGLVDMDASFTVLPFYLLKYADNLCVVTSHYDEYNQLADTLLEETGVPLRLSKSTTALCDCDLIIAPKGMSYQNTLKHNAVILSDRCEKDVPYTVISDYKIKLPQKLCDICPLWLDHTCFASALYIVERVYQLGSLLPALCVGNTQVHTLQSLCVALRNLCDKT